MNHFNLEFMKDTAQQYCNVGSKNSQSISNNDFSLKDVMCTDEKEYQRYLKKNTEENMLKFFKYNSWAFRTVKQGEVNNYA
jgi:type III secretory pathway component EscR